MLEQFRCGFYTVTKIIFIHRTTNFYAMSAPKIFIRILITYSMNPIIHHMLSFKFQILEKMRLSPCTFYACGLHVLCIVLMLIIHPYSGKHDVVEAITVVLGEMSISRRGFYAVTKLIFIHPTTNFYATSVQKTFLRILTILSMHPIGHHVPWFKFQIYEF